MRISMLAPFVVLACLISIAEAADSRSRVHRETFKAAPGGKLVIEADRGTLEIEGRDIDEVRVEVQAKVARGSDAKAAELLERHKVTLVQEGKVVRVASELEGEQKWNWRGPSLDVVIRALVPREFDLDASTAGGSVQALNLVGRTALRTSGGSVRLEKLEGSIQGRTAGGSIEGHQLQGEVDVSTSGGRIALEAVSGKHLKATTAGGGIRVIELTVPAELRTSGGSIQVESDGSPLTASTSGGSVAAEFNKVPTAECVLKTSGGSVSLSLPENAKFDLDASTSAGGVRSDFPVAVTTSSGERSSLKGPVNGGGPVMKLRSSAGSIHVKSLGS